MNKFKAKIRNRTIFLIILFVSMISIYLILFLNQDKLSSPSNDIINFHGGALSSFSILIILHIVRNLRAIRNENKLKKLYIGENDERSIMIMQKTGAFGINICIIGFACATIIAGYFNKVVFFTLLGSTLFVAIVKGLFKLYYRNKL